MGAGLGVGWAGFSALDEWAGGNSEWREKCGGDGLVEASGAGSVGDAGDRDCGGYGVERVSELGSELVWGVGGLWGVDGGVGGWAGGAGVGLVRVGVGGVSGAGLVVE